MEVFVVQGGPPLHGIVRVSGSKNASLPMMAAALLTCEPVVLNRVPDLVDVQTLAQLLHSLGCQVKRDLSDRLTLNVLDETYSEADYELVRRMRASVCVMGPLLARRGYARVSLPGGCNIGHRPIDIHLRGFAALGASVEIVNGNVVVQAPSLKGTVIDLGGPHGSTVTGTCNLLSAAVLAKGKTILTSAALEPEVYALAELLIAMGASISGHGTNTIEVVGVDELHGAERSVIPDRIEAATLMIATALTRGTITIENTQFEHLTAVSAILRDMGVVVEEIGISQVQIAAPQQLSPVNFSALPYPGIPTDVQAQMTALLATVAGTSQVRDQVFPDRFMHCAELNRMNARIRQQSDRALIQGGGPLQGAHVMASDLRASAALVLAALAAEGETVIHRIYHLDRGYESLEVKLNSMGANIIRCPEEAVGQGTPDSTHSIRRSA